MIRTTTVLSATAGLLASVSLVSCGQPPREAANRTAAATSPQTAALPSDLFVQAPPAGARSVSEVKGDLAAKGPVVIHGRIGGRTAPFADGAAVFLLADMSMKPCNELHGDSCPTPWDYCCEPANSLTARVATIQIVDDSGKPLRIGVKGRNGLSPLAEVTIAGEIVPRDSTDALLINAQGVYIHTPGG